MSDKFKAIVINQDGDNFTREVKSLDKNFDQINYDDISEIYLKDLKNLSDKFNDLKKNLSNNDKPQDQYSAEDLRKLNDILKSVDKD